MADVAFLKTLLAHTEKDIGRIEEGPVQDTLKMQAKRLRKMIEAASPKKKTKRKRK